MMLLFGTIPDKNLPLTYGQVRQEGDYLYAEWPAFFTAHRAPAP